MELFSAMVTVNRLPWRPWKTSVDTSVVTLLIERLCLMLDLVSCTSVRHLIALCVNLNVELLITLKQSHTCLLTGNHTPKQRYEEHLLFTRTNTQFEKIKTSHKPAVDTKYIYSTNKTPLFQNGRISMTYFLVLTTIGIRFSFCGILHQIQSSSCHRIHSSE